MKYVLLLTACLLASCVSSGQQTVTKSVVTYTYTTNTGTTVTDGYPLGRAAATGDVEMIRNLLASDPTARDKQDINGKTPLMRAAENCQAEAVKVLLEAGARAELADKEGFGALALACKATCKGLETLKHLVTGKADVNAAAKDGSMPLALALRAKNEEGALLLLEKGARVDSVDKFKYQALALAVMNHLTEAVKTLLASGADPNLISDSWPVLFPAVVARDLEIVKLLIKSGADVKRTDGNKKTLLMYARTPEIAKALIDAGVEVDAIDAFGFHALHYAAMGSKTEVLDMIAKASADMRYTEEAAGDIAIFAVYSKEREQVAKYFLSQGAVFYPAVRKYLGLPVGDKVIEETDGQPNRIVIVCSEGTGSAYWTGSGITLFQRHIKNPALKERYVGVVYHELDHYFFQGGGEISWFVEGVNSMLPIAAAGAGYLDPAKVPVSGVKAIWGLGNPSIEGDKPCVEDYRDSNYNYFYSKALKIQYLLHKELGSEKYQAFVKDVLDQVFNSPILLKDENGKIIELLEKQKKLDWKDFLTGWVFSGAYTKYSPAVFGDKNKNGIIDLDEKKADK